MCLQPRSTKNVEELTDVGTSLSSPYQYPSAPTQSVTDEALQPPSSLSDDTLYCISHRGSQRQGHSSACDPGECIHAATVQESNYPVSVTLSESRPPCNAARIKQGICSNRAPNGWVKNPEFPVIRRQQEATYKCRMPDGR
jgi:hypothetical protein